MTDSTLFRNGPIHTMAGSGPVEALVTRGDTIVHVGPEPRPPPPSTQIIDLHGRPLLPGFCDSHLHLVLAAEQRAAVDCRLAPDVETVQDRVRRRARHVRPGEWITGLGWEKKTLFRDRSPSPAPLDEAAPENPVYLLSKDVHSAWLNTAAVKRLLALETRPEKSVLHREQGLVLEEVMELRELLVPPRTADQKRAVLGPFVQELHARGITAVHTNEGIEELGVVRDHLSTAPVSQRLRVLWNPVLHSPDELRRRFSEAEAAAVPDWLGVGGAKLFLDGTLGSLTAALSVPYVGTADDLGMLTMEPGELAGWLRAIRDVGTYGVCHVIGDRAVAMLLTQIEQHGPGAPHRLEHAQLLPAGLGERALEGRVLSGQPSHMWGDREIVERNLTDALSRRAYAYRTMLERGGLVVFGSDAPVETINPWVGIQAAVTRLEDGATPPWNGDQRLSILEALTAHTASPARIHRHAFATGTLEVGRKADMVVLDRDPFTVDPTRLRKLRAEMVFLNGDRLAPATGQN